jgi:hypothetical protein
MRLRESLYQVCRFADVEAFLVQVYEHVDDVLGAQLEFQICARLPILLVDPGVSFILDLVCDFAESG